ncbi:MAG TPA: glucose 1-dehydrogenase [Ktedonobacteraceae bacterium]|nr:glucose 1-dehydrogenase [Ktedonobacteraceae bacterium]
MQAIAVVPHTKTIQRIEHTEPRILRPQQVKLRILDVGVCGTDKEICQSGFGTPPDGDDYLILGHEALAEVVEIGTAVQHLAPGDLVVPVVRRPCPHDECVACRAGRQDFCQTDDYTERGIKSMHGYMTEFVVDEERYLNFVPPNLRSVGVLVEPLTIAEKAIAEMQVIQQRLPWRNQLDPELPGKGLKALVLGSGPIGILGAMRLQVAGFETYVYSRSLTPNPKADIVKSIGATYISTQEMTVEQLVKRFGTYDLIYEALGAGPVIFEIIQALGPNGICILTGVPEPIGPTSINTARLIHQLVMHNQVFCGTVNANPVVFASAIQHLGIFVQRWPQAVQALITRHPIGNFEQVMLGKVGGIKNVLAFKQI